MKTVGSRKFLGFVLTLIAYTIVLIITITKVPNLVIDLPIFAVQCSMGYSIICGLFFGSNVLEHFADKRISPQSHGDAEK